MSAFLMQTIDTMAIDANLLPVLDGLAWHERVHHDPANTWLREQIVQATRPRA